MGIAASQARYLYLTARQVTVEFEGQQLNQARTMLANESAGLFRELSALECPTCPTVYQVNTDIAKWIETGGPNPEDYEGGESNAQYIKDKGVWEVYKSTYDNLIEQGKTTAEAEASAQSAAYTQATDQYNNDKTEYDKASAEIEAKSEKIQQQDKTLELQLRQLDTERQTITTELDSVKKVLDKNIEQVFKTFQS